MPNQRPFIVDVEATANTPYSGVMTEFGVVDLTTRHWFHGHLWDFQPHPDVPARPVATTENPGFTATVPGHHLAFDGNRRNIDPLIVDRTRRVYTVLDSWLHQLADGARPVFVSDNPAYDFMWIADGFDRHGMTNPFGHTGRRIGDLAAGLSGNWLATSRWKRLRRTPHDHNPVHDALGNAEALTQVLHNHGQLPVANT